MGQIKLRFPDGSLSKSRFGLNDPPFSKGFRQFGAKEIKSMNFKLYLFFIKALGSSSHHDSWRWSGSDA